MPASRLPKLTTAGAGAVVDFVGSTETAALGMEVLRRGGTYVLVGLYGGRLNFPTLALPTRDIALRGSYVGNLGEMHELMELVKAGKVDPIPVSARPMSEVTKTLQDLEDGRIIGRVVVVPDGVSPHPACLEWIGRGRELCFRPLPVPRRDIPRQPRVRAAAWRSGPSGDGQRPPRNAPVAGSGDLPPACHIGSIERVA